MTNSILTFENGAAVDAELTKVANSNLSSTHKITRSATLVVAASNSSAKGKAQADYVCDGTNDEVEIISAVTELGTLGGTIKLTEGTFVAQGLPLVSKVSYEGQNSGATIIQLPVGATTHMFLTSGDSEIRGGAIRDISLDGTNAPTRNAIDFSSASTLYEFYIEHCYIHGFNHGYHGSLNDRFCQIQFNRIMYNQVGVYVVNNHPWVQFDDIRYNVVGLGGDPYDMECYGVGFNYNTYGAMGMDGGEIKYCQFINCSFTQSTTGIVLDSENNLNTCLFIGKNDGDTAIQIKGTTNTINNCNFRSDVDSKFGVAAIEFLDGNDCSRTIISNNQFALPGSGDVILSGTGSGTARRELINISNNTFKIGGHAINFPNAEDVNSFYMGVVSGNIIDFTGNIGTDPLMNFTVTDGGVFVGNSVYVRQNSTVGAALNLDALDAIITNNRIRRTTGITTTRTNANTINTNNIIIP